MALSPIYYARGDSGTAANDAVNVRPLSQVPVTSIQFTDDDPNSTTTGDLDLDFIDANPSPSVIEPSLDPDTWIILNGQTYRFALVKTGTLPTAGVPTALHGDTVFVIQVDIDGDGILETSDPRYFFTMSPDGTIANMEAIGNGSLTLGNVDETPCFCSGTEIATPSGVRLVETLRPGDSVLTEDGRIAQVAWVGISTREAGELWLDSARRPVRVPANAFGAGLPLRDLDVSPQHRIVVEGPDCELLFGMPRAFVVAKHLLGGVAHTPEVEGPVQYVHVLLENHEILIGNGLPSESFQPARRMLELMSGENLDRLNAALSVLGEEAMLTRPDALPTLSSREAKVLVDRLSNGLAVRSANAVVELRAN